MCDKPVSRLNQAIGRKKSIAMVLRAPSGDPSAEFMSVGASRTVHTTKHKRPTRSAFFQAIGIRFGGTSPRASSLDLRVPAAGAELCGPASCRVWSSVSTVTDRAAGSRT